MGVCTSRLEKGVTHGQGPGIDAIPSDTAFLKQATLPVLAFYVLISDIKLKKCPNDRISLRFVLDDIDSFTTPQQSPDRYLRVYWKVPHVFDFYMNEYELRNRFLLVEAVDGRGETVGRLKMNMFTLWTGPYHQDFPLRTIKPGNCRISFNFKISQGIHMKISNTYTEMLPKQETFVGQSYAYSIEAIIGQQMQQATCPYVVRVRSGNDDMRHLNEDVFVEKGCICWEQPQSLPKFDKKIAYYQIYSSSLHLIFYKLTKSPTIGSPTAPVHHHTQMLSQCFIPFRKLMSLDYLQFKDPSTNITYHERNVELLEKTWLHGKQMGKAKIKFKFVMQAHLKQMQACVRTEQGIMASSPVFSQGNTSHGCEEITALGKLNTEVQQEFLNMEDAFEHFNMIAMKENALRISTLLTRELALLERSSKESILFYEYKDEMELYKAQRFLIDFAFKVMTYVREDKPDICEVSWSLLTAILKRGEFRLTQMGFSREEREALENGNSSEGLHLKVEVALKYQQLLNKLLRETLTLLQCKGEEAQRVFAQSFCAYAYFRIPAFREQILSTVSRQEDPEITQWRGTEVNLNESGEGVEQKGEDFYRLHFSWENNFYKAIEAEELHKQYNIELQSILKPVEWKNRLGKRSGIFYSFLENLVEEIEYVSVVSKYIRWHHLPGYNRLLHAFLVEFKEKRICDYTNRMKRTTLKLLSNERLLNVLVVLLLKKTNLNEPATVEVTLNMIDSFFQTLSTHQRLIPSTFDYHFFLEGIKMVLHSDLQYCITQALLLIYNNIYNFSQQFGLELCLYLLSSFFFKFFFHWSHNLRHIFHLLILVRIARYSEQRLSITLQKHNVENVYTMSLKIIIKERLEMLMGMAKKEESTASSTNIDMFREKELYKKMRYKLKDRKREQRKHKVTSITVIEDVFLPDLRIAKSAMKVNAMSTSKLIYFKDEEMTMIGPKKELRYVRDAFSEYASMVDEVEKCMQRDPKFVPEIKMKRIVDESQIGPAKADEW